MVDSEWSRPAGLKLARENLQSRVKEEDSITDVENTSEGQSLHASRPSRLCAQAQLVKDKQEKDKIGSKPGKNGKRGEARRSQKQLQSR
nr:hypothetical protein [Tanacetum cinerariifolium]